MQNLLIRVSENILCASMEERTSDLLFKGILTHSSCPCLWLVSFGSLSPSVVLSSDDEGADEMNDVSGSLQEQRISEGIRDAQVMDKVRVYMFLLKLMTLCDEHCICLFSTHFNPKLANYKSAYLCYKLFTSKSNSFRMLNKSHLLKLNN